MFIVFLVLLVLFASFFKETVSYQFSISVFIPGVLTFWHGCFFVMFAYSCYAFNF